MSIEEDDNDEEFYEIQSFFDASLIPSVVVMDGIKLDSAIA